MDVDRNPSPLAALAPPYRPIFDRLLAVCEADERIRALWLRGSLADGASDLDALIAVRDEDFDDFAVRWRQWLAAITPTLIAQGTPGGARLLLFHDHGLRAPRRRLRAGEQAAGQPAPPAPGHISEGNASAHPRRSVLSEAAIGGCPWPHGSG